MDMKAMKKIGFNASGIAMNDVWTFDISSTTWEGSYVPPQLRSRGYHTGIISYLPRLKSD